MSTRTAVYAITGNEFSALSVGFCTLRHQTPICVRLKLSALAGASAAETRAALRHDLRELAADPVLAAEVAGELARLDTKRAIEWGGLLCAHLGEAPTEPEGEEA